MPGQFWTGDLGLENVPPLSGGVLNHANINKYAGMAVAQADFNGDGEMGKHKIIFCWSPKQ